MRGLRCAVADRAAVQLLQDAAMTLDVVGLSGGKDSTALAWALKLREPWRRYEYICNETGNELPEMHAHWAFLEKLLDAPIKRVRYHTDLVGAIEEQNMLPNVFRRWCTRILKIEPTIEYFESLPDDAVLHVGLRADEEMRRGLYGEDINVRFALREWGMDEAAVLKFLDDWGIEIPLRTDCGLCPYQRLGEWRDLYFKHPVIWLQGIELEDKFGKTIRSPGRDAWPADLRSLGEEFKRGRPLREFKRATTCRVCSL